MGENTFTLPPSQRITVIDALRGFALLGVILMHMIDRFGFTAGNMPGAAAPPMWDGIIQWFTNTMIKGKFITIFSFLFGLSFYIQMDRAAKKGVDFRKRFLWRMLLLFVIGSIGLSFTYVDILTIYAVCGVVLVFLFPAKNWVLTLLACLLLIGIPNWFIIGFDNIRFGNIANEQPVVTTLPNTTEQQAITAFPDISEEPAAITSRDTAEQPLDNNSSGRMTFLQSVKENLTVNNLNKLKSQFMYGSTGYMILALFIMGLMVGRLRFFEQVHIRKKRNISLFLLFMVSAIVIFIVIKLMPEAPVDFYKIKTEGGEAPFISLVDSALSGLLTITLSASMAMGFIVLYQVEGIRKYLNLLTPYGRMGLTNYEIQNVTGAILFSGWGFGAVFGAKGATILFVTGLAIYSLQVIISEKWLKHFLYGPLEWFWRSGTYLKWQPFKKKTITGKSGNPVARNN